MMYIGVFGDFFFGATFLSGFSIWISCRCEFREENNDDILLEMFLYFVEIDLELPRV